jgi:membrane peptidoglycan carboxypeptidase
VSKDSWDPDETGPVSGGGTMPWSEQYLRPRRKKRPDRRSPERRKRRRRRWKIAGASCLVLLLIMVGGVVILYVTTKVPKPSEISTNQVSTITYSDGKTVMAKIGAQNRTDVPISKVPVPVRNDVLAAEDRGFYSEPGISPKGIARAAWADIRGGSVQGGSTITQQDVKNAFLTQQRTFSRKFREIFIAVKLDRKYSKDQILDWYLNTIYFGRGAYGIEAAAETYFGKPVNELNVAQGAVLASSIRSPALYDPQNHPANAKARWQFVIQGMVKMGKLTDQQASALRYPKVKPIGPGSLNQDTGPAGYIVSQVKDELAANGFDESTLNRDGLRIVTTIDPKAQQDAEAAVDQTFAGQPKNLRQALVAVDPSSGKVLAYYGGSSGDGFDYAQAWRQPGSTFKPYVLATALTQTQQGKADITDNTQYDGSSGQLLGGVLVHNSDGESCSVCSVTTAMTMSLNTVFYKIGLQVGPKNVAATAHAAGIPTRRNDNHQPTLQNSDGQVGGGISIGQYEVRPIDQASGYATLADGGVAHTPYFVQEVTDSSGHVLYQHTPAGKRVFTPQVANDVTYSMEQVASSSGDGLADARPTASKTGTAQLADTGQNKDAWMAGFTPKVSAAVWVGTDGSEPIVNSAGSIVYGSGLPGKTWQAFMDSYLAGSAVQPLPAR